MTFSPTYLAASRHEVEPGASVVVVVDEGVVVVCGGDAVLVGLLVSTDVGAGEEATPAVACARVRSLVADVSEQPANKDTRLPRSRIKMPMLRTSGF